MLHDSRISGHDRPEGDPRDQDTDSERRETDRAPSQAEVIVVWHHDQGIPVRYAVVDIGDGGMRILSSTPLLKGMSGTAVKLLPKGEPINRSFIVAWSRPPAVSGAFEVGLQFG